MDEHDTKRFRSRRRTGHRLLCLALGLYGVALWMPVFWESSPEGWKVFGELANEIQQLIRNREWIMAVFELGVVYVNVVAGAAALGLALGWVWFSRAAGCLSLLTFWPSLLALVMPKFGFAKLPEFVTNCFGAWFWVASLHVLALAAFVTPRRPRQPDAD